MGQFQDPIPDLIITSEFCLAGADGQIGGRETMAAYPHRVARFDLEGGDTYDMFRSALA